MTQRGTLYLVDVFDIFMLDCEARRLTPATRQFYRAKLSIFLRWCRENDVNDLSALTANNIRQFLVHIQRRQLSSQYQHNLARAIRAFLNFCVRDELIERSPFAKVQMPRLAKKVLQAFSLSEIKALLRNCSCERDKAICLVLLDSGVRASELIALNVGDIDMQSGMVIVRAGKGQKERTTYIGARTRKQVKRYLAQREFAGPYDAAFVSHRTETRLTLSGVVQIMERLREQSGVASCSCHTFRRTFALSCLRNGMNIYVLARIMGHADITVLRQYLAFVEGDLQEAHAQFGTVDNLRI